LKLTPPTLLLPSKSINIRKRVFGDCSEVAATYHKLANTHVQLKQLEKALIFFKESIRIIKKVGEKNDLYTVSFDMVSFVWLTPFASSIISLTFSVIRQVAAS
jgi:hypothetical protein